jgi:hypothetical protein
MAGLWFSPGAPVSSTNKTDCHDITELLLKVALSTINLLKFDMKKDSVVYFICLSYHFKIYKKWLEKKRRYIVYEEKTMKIKIILKDI